MEYVLGIIEHLLTRLFTNFVAKEKEQHEAKKFWNSFHRRFQTE